MFIAAGGERDERSIRGWLPQAWLRNEATDASNGDGERLVGKDSGGHLGRGREDQFKVFSVSQSMLQRQLTVSHRQLLGCWRNRDLAQIEGCSQAARFTKAREIEAQAVPHAHCGMDVVPLGKQQRFANSRRKIKVLTQDAAAEAAGDQDFIASFCAAPPPFFAGRYFADSRNADDQRAVPATGVSPGDRGLA